MSHATTMLAAIEAVLEGRIDSDVESYQIAGRQITKIPFSELREMRDYYKSEASREKNKENVALGKGNRNKIKTKFV